MKPLRTTPLALSLGSFFSITYVLCIVWGLLVPNSLATMSKFLSVLLPGFEWLSFGSFLLGLVESFLYGVYAAVVFAPLYNFFSRLAAGEARTPVSQPREVPHHP